VELDVSGSGGSYSLGSKVCARLLERLCGARSESKPLRDFIRELSTERRELLPEALIDGDGNDRDVYYISGDRLANDVARLRAEVWLILPAVTT